MSPAPFQERAWYKSSYSNGGQNDCIEVNPSRPGHVGVRDSKLGSTSPMLPIRAAQWVCLIAAVQDGTLGA
ncbi:MAG: DUF397 domain-containing protein [Pseudonocardiales bacterium]|nr:DUF397 domain-containing protein [Pseudonocardiales bacterium]